MFQKAAYMNPTSEWTWSNLGKAYQTKGDHGGAIEMFQKAVDTNPTSEWAWRNLAEAYQAKGDHDRAIEMFQKAADMNPTSEWVCGNLAEAYQTKGDHDRAIEIFQKAVDTNPKSLWAWRNLGEAYRAKGDRDRAIITFEATVGMFPADYFCVTRLISLYQTFDDTGHYEKALDVYKQVAERAGGIPFFCAFMSLELVTFDTIDPSFINAFLWPSLVRVHNAIGEGDEAFNICDRAIDEYTKAIKMGGNNLHWICWGVGISQKKLPTLWVCSALGEAHKWKMESNLLRANLDGAENDAKMAVNAFQHALDLQQDNAWLKEVLSECRMMQLRIEEANVDSEALISHNFPTSQSYLSCGHGGTY